MKTIELDSRTYYIDTYLQEFEDGKRIISVGLSVDLIKGSNITSEDLISGTIAHSIKSPNDEYSEEIETKIITGRISKRYLLETCYDIVIPRKLSSKRVYEKMLYNYAKSIMKDLSKKYKVKKDES